MWVVAEAEDGIRDFHVTGVQTCALPIFSPLETVDTVKTTQGRSLAMHTCNQIIGRGPLLKIYSKMNRTLLRGHAGHGFMRQTIHKPLQARSEERRVGKECRCGWWRKQKTAYEIFT